MAHLVNDRSLESALDISVRLGMEGDAQASLLVENMWRELVSLRARLEDNLEPVVQPPTFVPAGIESVREVSQRLHAGEDYQGNWIIGALWAAIVNTRQVFESTPEHNPSYACAGRMLISDVELANAIRQQHPDIKADILAGVDKSMEQEATLSQQIAAVRQEAEVSTHYDYVHAAHLRAALATLVMLEAVQTTNRLQAQAPLRCCGELDSVLSRGEEPGVDMEGMNSEQIQRLFFD